MSGMGADLKEYINWKVVAVTAEVVFPRIRAKGLSFERSFGVL